MSAREPFVVGCHSSYAPGKRGRAGECCDVVFTFVDNSLDVAASTYTCLFRHPWQDSGESKIFCAVEKQTRVVGEVAFGEENLDVGCRLNDEGQESEAFWVELRDGAFGVGVFERIEELILKITFFSYIWHGCRVVSGEGVFDFFVDHVDGFLTRVYPVVCDTVVVGTEYYRPIFVGLEGELIVFVGNSGAAVERRLDSLVDTGGFG